MSDDVHQRADQVVGFTDRSDREHFHALLTKNIRSHEARAQALYDSLPWHRRLLRRRPAKPTGSFRVQ